MHYRFSSYQSLDEARMDYGNWVSLVQVIASRLLDAKLLLVLRWPNINMIHPTDSHLWSHNPSHNYPTMLHLVTELCPHVHISVSKCCIVGYGTNALWDLSEGSIDSYSILVKISKWNVMWTDKHYYILRPFLCATLHFIYISKQSVSDVKQSLRPYNTPTVCLLRLCIKIISRYYYNNADVSAHNDICNTATSTKKQSWIYLNECIRMHIWMH